MRSCHLTLRSYLKILFYLSLLPLFQNCGNGVGFGKQDESNNTQLSVPKPVYITTKKSISFNINTDILFVLDDSCSMGSIIDNVRNGVDSLSTLSFAPNTEMAVTYMSPALNFEGGGYDYVHPYYSKSLNSPGYMQFVSKQSIEFFLSTLTDSEKNSQVAENFSTPSCDKDWFGPTETPAGVSSSCFAGAMQFPSYCTGVEAGGLVMDQLAKKLTASAQKLFRDQANAHVVFVSDTHDAGANFYGTKPVHPARIPNVDELKATILANNSTLQSIRFSGIIPLPLVGDEKLNGLNVIGPIPQTPEEQYINSEGDHDFSYLDLIKGTGGVAMHAQSDDWSGALKKIIEFTKTPTSVLVLLQSEVEEVLSVSVNGVKIAKSQFILQSDHKTVEVFHAFGVGQSYDIQVESMYHTKP